MASRQAAYQRRNKAAGLCVVCGNPLFNASYCYKHAVAVRERQRKRNNSVKRFKGCPSYTAPPNTEDK